MNLIDLVKFSASDIDEIVDAFNKIGWHKPRSIYESYLKDEVNGNRIVILAKVNNKFCGYVTIKWISAYSEFSKNNIPEIVDLNVLPKYQKQGMGTRLIKQCEKLALEKGHTNIGLGVGLTADYGNAQRLYVQLGYVPDGRGLHSYQKSISLNEKVTVDDELILYFEKSLLNSCDIKLDLPASIQTPKLILRSPKIGDETALNSAIIESFDELNKYMLWAKDKPTLEESKEVIKRESAAWILNKKTNAELMFLIFDKNTNDFIGATGFHNIDWDVPCAETGYWIRKKYTRHGYMTEAINAVTRYGFEVLKLKRLAITCDIDNERSKKIPERLSYQLESLMKLSRIKPITGEVTDTLVYVITDVNSLPELNIKWGND